MVDSWTVKTRRLCVASLQWLAMCLSLCARHHIILTLQWKLTQDNNGVDGKDRAGRRDANAQAGSAHATVVAVSGGWIDGGGGGGGGGAVALAGQFTKVKFTCQT